MTISAVAFDIDGTLYPNSEMYLRSIPFGMRHPRLMLAFGRVRKQLREIRPIENFYGLQAELMAEEFGVPVGRMREQIDTLIYGEWEQVLKRVSLYRGLGDFLTTLRQSGLKLGVMSDFPVERKLGILGLSDVWDCSVSAERTGYLKPAPEPFLALSGCLDTPREQVLYVGNSFRYDVIGAARAGMYTAHLDRSLKRDAEFIHSDRRVPGNPEKGALESEPVSNIRFRDYHALEKLLVELLPDRFAAKTTQ